MTHLISCPRNHISLARRPFLPVFLALSIGAFLGAGCASKEDKPEPSTPLANAVEMEHGAQIEQLISKMTLEEKIGQMVLITHSGNITGPGGEREDLEDLIRSGRCGAVFNAHTVRTIRHLQQLAVEKTRLKIPLLFGYDVIHGYKTIFPIPLGEASSWDTNAMEMSARIAATEASASGLNWTFAPMVDIARDPRWGRIAEGAGEDPYLGCQVAQARVRGFQGKGIGDLSSVAACVKHFAAYGAAQAGRDYNTVDMSERTLREVYLPPYKGGVDAGALSVMTSFNEINGVPATANKFLLQEVLRKEWGFKGFVVTDYTSINELTNHGIAATDQDAVKLALDAGVDMDLQGGVYLNYLKNLVATGQVRESQVDEAARRILLIKYKLGLFEDPYRFCDEERERNSLYTPGNLQVARQIADESMVLLKNDRHALPLKAGATIAVIGPLADAKSDLLGTWAGRGEGERTESIYRAISRANKDGQTILAQGCDVLSSNRTGFSEAVEAGRKSDVVVMVLGETASMSGEASSRTSINLPGIQGALLSEMKAVGKPLVVVLLNGRPLALEQESALADSILEAWHPGSAGAQAVADNLFGAVNPSGKLPVTFPRNLGQVPIYYAHKMTGRPLDPEKPAEKYKSKYLDSPNDPLYPFGYGLSYTTFEYGPVELDADTLKSGGQLTATVKISNTGGVDGAEVVQLYVRQMISSVTRPVLELKGFEKIFVKAGESTNVSFVLHDRDLAFLRADMSWGNEEGVFKLFVGPNSRDLNEKSFHYSGRP